MGRTNGKPGGRIFRLTAAVTLAFVAVAVLMGVGTVYAQSSNDLVGVFTGGSLKQLNSRAGAAIVTGERLVPGAVRRSLVVIANDGEQAAASTLSQTNVVDTPGRGGVSLAAVLQLTVADTTGMPETVVYRGPLNGLTSVDLGVFKAGESRSYRFTVSFPDGAGTNADVASAGVAGAELSVEYDWTAVAV